MNLANLNKRTLALISGGVVSLASVVQAAPSEVLTALTPTTLSGFVDTSAQWNIGSGNANNPAYIFGGPAKADGFNLNVVKLVVEKPAELSDEWGAGYKVDLLFGPDAITYGTTPVGGGPGGGFAVKQAYVDLKAPLGNGIEFKIGVWDTILGYEVFEPTLNPNYTKSFGYTIEPATFTGVQATYNITEFIAVTAGVANTLSSTIGSRAFPARSESYKAYLGDVSLTAPTTASWGWFGGSTLFAAVVNGYNPGSPAIASLTTGGAPADQTSIYVGATVTTPLKALKVGLAYDYAGVSKQALSSSGYANAAGLYLLYQASDKLALNCRGEWFTQTHGNSAAALPSKVAALTFTAQYSLWKNVQTEGEFRWDHSADGSHPFGGTVAGTSTARNATELIASIIYKF